MPSNLVFGRPRHAGGPVPLVFGGSGPVVLPGPVQVTITAQLPDAQVQALALYDNKNPRRASTAAALPHQVAGRASAEPRTSFGQAAQQRLLTADAWAVAAQVDGQTRAAWDASAHVTADRAAAWALGVPASAAWALVHQAAAVVGTQAATAWVMGAPVSARWALAHDRATALRLAAVDRWQVATHRHATSAVPWGIGAHRSAVLVAPWQLGRPVPPGSEVWSPNGPPVRPPRVPDTDLVFACLPWLGGGVHLVFGHVCAPSNPALVAIPVRTYYMTINSIALRRVDGNITLPAYGFNMSLDADSWTWSWSATLDRSAEAALQPDVAGQPVELEAVVNGVAYRLLVGKVGRSSQFPVKRLAVSGRGLAHVLADPNAPVTTYSSPVDLTAQQLMEQVLTVNGQPIGWTLAWGLTDWLVPGGAWTFQGTPIEALVDIAGAAGGYLQPHATAQTLRVLPRYPTPPWEWASAVPDIELPSSVVSVESVEWVDRPAYNRVFVGGLGAGVFGPVTRAGTAGDLIAPQVTHPLITDADAHRQRGLSVLADTGRQVHLDLQLPVLPETGLILPGQMVRYVGDQTRKGIVRRVSLDWSTPVMHQTIGVETHVA